MKDINSNAPVEGDPAGIPPGCVVLIVVVVVVVLAIGLMPELLQGVTGF